MKGKRLAFGYQARVGKDTAAEYLVLRDTNLSKPLNTRGVIKSFAKAIYDIMGYAQQRCGFAPEKDRQFLQYIGTEWARAKDPDVWLNVILREIEQQSPETPIYITDVRFPNEYDALEKLGFTMVNVRRDAGRAEFGSGSVQHPSETALIPYTQQGKWHLTIQNDGTLEEFYQHLDSLFPRGETEIPMQLNLMPNLGGTAVGYYRCPRCKELKDERRCSSCYAEISSPLCVEQMDF